MTGKSGLEMPMLRRVVRKVAGLPEEDQAVLEDVGLLREEPEEEPFKATSNEVVYPLHRVGDRITLTNEFYPWITVYHVGERGTITRVMHTNLNGTVLSGENDQNLYQVHMDSQPEVARLLLRGWEFELEAKEASDGESR